MAKPNYKHAKKQKEAARKARQDAKQQRRAIGPEDGSVTGDLPEAVDAPEAPVGAAPIKAEA